MQVITLEFNVALAVYSLALKRVNFAIRGNSGELPYPITDLASTSVLQSVGLGCGDTKLYDLVRFE